CIGLVWVPIYQDTSPSAFAASYRAASSVGYSWAEDGIAQDASTAIDSRTEKRMRLKSLAAVDITYSLPVLRQAQLHSFRLSNRPAEPVFLTRKRSPSASPRNDRPTN